MYNGKLIVDLFAGGGGASTGIEMALGVSPDVAVNHDPEAIALHQANHPNTKHFIEDVFDVNPYEVCGGNEVALLWLSPDCKHFSKAKGSKPVSCEVRSLAWVGVKWARMVKPDTVILENVEEFQTWGPIDDDGKPIKSMSGNTFQIYVDQFRKLGYNVEWKELTASDYGAPTIRKRLFMIAKKDNGAIIWPEPTHGDPKKYPDRIPWKTAASCIDFTQPAYSIFMSKEEAKKYGIRRPLAEKTMERIARGIKKFVIDDQEPYVIDGQAEFISTFYGGDAGKARGSSAHSPVGTITAGGGRHAICAVHLAQANKGNVGRRVEEPVSTVTTTGSQQQLVVSFATKMRGTNIGFDLRTPVHTITSSGTHIGEVRGFLLKYYGTGEGQRLDDPAHTITTKERFAIVEVHGEKYEIVDVCMRMLTPRELYRAQGFPDSYKIDIEYNGKPLTKKAQVRMCGNSVVPQLARVLVEANVKCNIEEAA